MRLGLLQLRRARRRTSVLIATVVALTTLVLMVSTISSTLFTSLAGAVATMPTDVVALTSASQGTVQASRVGSDTIAEVSRVEGVHRVAPVGESRVTVLLEGERLDASLFGIDPQGPGGPSELVAGRLPASPTEALADDADVRRGVTLGSHLEVVGSDTTVEVVGLTRGARFGGLITLYVPYQTWHGVLTALFPDATEIRPSLIAVDGTADAAPEELAARITAAVDGVAARTPATAAMELPGLAGIRDSFRLIGLIAAGSALLLIGTFWSLVTAQQAATLAALRAAGVAAAPLVRALVVQVVVVVGVGVALASALLWVGGRQTPPTFPLTPEPTEVALIALTLLAGGVAAVMPAIVRMLRIDPVTALARAQR